MQFIIAGLGNPGEEYEHTRHNAGRMAVKLLAHDMGATEWSTEKMLRAQTAKAKTTKGDSIRFVLPDNFMNRSGASLAPLAKTPKERERLIVLHDDIDLPLGTIRIVFNRGAGGHNGVLSIERALKSRAFVRVRIGVLPTTPVGKLKKPKGEGAVHDFILKQLSKKEQDALVLALTRAKDATRAILEEGREFAMCEYNG